MVIPTRVFIHGLESTSRGTKATFFRKRYPAMIIEDFVGPIHQRMEKLNHLLENQNDLILVGSSYGGLMAAIYSCSNERSVKKLILLAPALNLPEFIPYLNVRTDVPTIIFHGRRDDLVPPQEIKNIARAIFANLSYHLLDDDHVLRKSFTDLNWDELLRLP
jgi:pimeloyl-ACP methyl ester carboxylesterase